MNCATLVVFVALLLAVSVFQAHAQCIATVNGRCPRGYVNNRNECCPAVGGRRRRYAHGCIGNAVNSRCPEGYATYCGTHCDCCPAAKVAQWTRGSCPPEKTLGPAGANDSCPPRSKAVKGFCCEL